MEEYYFGSLDDDLNFQQKPHSHPGLLPNSQHPFSWVSPVLWEGRIRRGIKPLGRDEGDVKKSGQKQTVGTRCPFLEPHALWLNPNWELRRATNFQQTRWLECAVSLEPQELSVFGGVWLKNLSWVVAAENRWGLNKLALIWPWWGNVAPLYASECIAFKAV